MDSRLSARGILEGVAREGAVLIFRSICPELNRECSNSASIQDQGHGDDNFVQEATPDRPV